MFLFHRKGKGNNSSASQTDGNGSITESLYKQNLELATKNKTFSLLRQLYQISILALEPEKLGKELVKTLNQSLEFELVGILTIGEDRKLSPLAFAASERLEDAEKKAGYFFEKYTIENPPENPFLDSIINKKVAVHGDNFGRIWKDLIPREAMVSFVEASHVKTISGYPLIVDNKLIGILVFCLNRAFDSLAQYEKESIETFADVIAVALNTSFLYKEIKETSTKLAIANTRLKELDQQKTEFISFATHQLRGPLTAIKGYASLILEGDYGNVSDAIKEAVKIIFDSTQSLVIIVGDYLNVSRIEQGRMRYDFQDFDLKDLVNDVVKELTPNVRFAGLEMTYNIPKENFLINADKGKIKEVISNLLDNSTKYTKKGGIDIHLEKLDGEKCRIYIKDTGIGIPKEIMPILFEKFSRAPDASKTNIMGTGLGLFVAKNIIGAHPGGKIWAESEGAGKGSTFIIELGLKGATQKVGEAVKKFAKSL